MDTTPQAGPSTRSVADVVPILQTLAPILIAVGAGLYVLGLLIVNLDLGRRGYLVLDLACGFRPS